MQTNDAGTEPVQSDAGTAAVPTALPPVAITDVIPMDVALFDVVAVYGPRVTGASVQLDDGPPFLADTCPPSRAATAGESICFTVAELEDEATTLTVRLFTDDGRQTVFALAVRPGPAVREVIPNPASPGTDIDLRGEGLSLPDGTDLSAVSVAFPGPDAPVVVTPSIVTDRLIRVTVPVDAQSGPVVVTHPTFNDELPLVIGPRGYVRTVEPRFMFPRETAVIRGDNLDEVVALALEGDRITSFAEQTPTLIRFEVPAVVNARATQATLDIEFADGTRQGLDVVISDGIVRDTGLFTRPTPVYATDDFARLVLGGFARDAFEVPYASAAAPVEFPSALPGFDVYRPLGTDMLVAMDGATRSILVVDAATEETVVFCEFPDARTTVLSTLQTWTAPSIGQAGFVVDRTVYRVDRTDNTCASYPLQPQTEWDNPFLVVTVHGVPDGIWAFSDETAWHFDAATGGLIGGPYPLSSQFRGSRVSAVTRVGSDFVALSIDSEVWRFSNGRWNLVGSALPPLQSDAVVSRDGRWIVSLGTQSILIDAESGRAVRALEGVETAWPRPDRAEFVLGARVTNEVSVIRLPLP